jgi:hypothetical protein
MSKFTWKHSVVITGVAFLLPLVISGVYRVTDIGSVGPVVFFYSLAMAIVFPFIYCSALLKSINKPTAIGLGIVSGLFVAVLLLNYFMFVTYLFEIKDYDAM